MTNLKLVWNADNPTDGHQLTLADDVAADFAELAAMLSCTVFAYDDHGRVSIVTLSPILEN